MWIIFLPVRIAKLIFLSTYLHTTPLMSNCTIFWASSKVNGSGALATAGVAAAAALGFFRPFLFLGVDGVDGVKGVGLSWL